MVYVMEQIIKAIGNEDQIEVDFSTYTKGLYFIIVQKNDTRYVMKVLKN